MTQPVHILMSSYAVKLGLCSIALCIRHDAKHSVTQRPSCPVSASPSLPLQNVQICTKCAHKPLVYGAMSETHKLYVVKTPGRSAL